MKKILPFLLFCSLLNFSYAEIINEDFSNWSDNSYGGISLYTDANGGMWESNNALVSASSGCNASSMRFNDDSGADEYFMYKGLDGNGKDVGIGDISFSYRHWDADGSAVSFLVQYNQNGGGWTNIGVETVVTSTTCMVFSETVNLSGDDILIRVIAVQDDERLVIDDFSVSEFSGSAPVSLAAFTANLKDQSVLLSWTTASEENNDYFAIEHSTDGVHFTEVDIVKGAGTSFQENHYEYLHRQAVKGNNYYRLAQVDLSRSISYSPVEIVNIKGADLFSLSPTLAKGEVVLTFSQDLADDTHVEVFDLLGRRVLTENADRGLGQVQLHIADLQNGHYLVVMKNAGEMHSARFIKH